MKNAHQRFGKLVYVRHSEKASTNIRVHLDAFVGEARGKAHFVSVIGGDWRLEPWQQRLGTVTCLP